jgi:hypothetical protein
VTEVWVSGRQANFWENEGGGDIPGQCAPLLNRNAGLLKTDAAANSALLARSAKWAELCGADKVTELPKVRCSLSLVADSCHVTRMAKPGTGKQRRG